MHYGVAVGLHFKLPYQLLIFRGSMPETFCDLADQRSDLYEITDRDTERHFASVSRRTCIRLAWRNQNFNIESKAAYHEKFVVSTLAPTLSGYAFER